jgi:predicted RNA-binding Zn-ribbon protein involved in translation (DUF1610 family)
MSLVCNEKEWTAYVKVVMKSEIHGIELVPRMVARNEVSDESSRSPTLPEVVYEQHVECGIVLTQPSQESHDDTDADELPFAGNNETMLNLEPVSRSVSVDDVVAVVGFISGVDPQPTGIGFTLAVDPPFVKPLFMPEYEATFGDEQAKDSADDRLVLELSNMTRFYCSECWRNMLLRCQIART